MEIESLSANSCFSLHLVAVVGFAAVAEREQRATSGRDDDDEFRGKEERLREKNLRKERRLETRGVVVIESGFGRSKDVIVNLLRAETKRIMQSEPERELKIGSHSVTFSFGNWWGPRWGERETSCRLVPIQYIL